MTIKRKLWGRTPDGKAIFRYTLTNGSGASVVLGSVGAAIVSVNVPDKDDDRGTDPARSLLTGRPFDRQRADCRNDGTAVRRQSENSYQKEMRGGVASAPSCALR